MAADGGGPMTPGTGGGGFEKAPAEMLTPPTPLEGQAKTVAEQQARDAELKRANAEAGADALLNPPLPEETPVGQPASGSTMRDVEERLGEVPQPALAAEAQVLAEAMGSQPPDREETERGLIPAPETGQEERQKSAPAEEGEVHPEDQSGYVPEEMKIAGQTADEYAKEKYGERYSSLSDTDRKPGLEKLEAARQEMMQNGQEPGNWEEVERFVGEKVARAQEAASPEPQVGGPGTMPPAAEVAQAEPGAEPRPPVAPVAPAEAAPVSEVAPSVETPAEVVPETEAETAAPTEEGAGMTPPAPESAPALSEAEKLKQEIDAALQGNKEYLAAKQALEGNVANKRWQEIDAMPEDQRDAAIDDLKGDKKAYEKYVEQREQVYMTEKHAEWNAREKKLNDLEEEIKKLPNTAERITKEGQLREGRKALEDDRRKTESASALAKDTDYQDLKRKYRKAENRLVELYMGPDKRGDKRTKEQAEEMVRDLAGKKWGDLSEAEREAFGGNEALFNKSYSFDRSVMNGSESYVKSKTDLARIEKGVNPDGSKIPPDQIAARTQEYYESRITDKRQGPGRMRKGFKWLARGIDKYFGRAEMNDHGKKALGHAKSLISDYGWKGLFAQWLLPKEKRETAKNLRKLMTKEMGAYLVRFGLRKPLQFIGLSLLFWLVLPVVIGKGLELTKPFGGNG